MNPSWFALLATAGTLAGLYAIVCTLWPITDCWRCHGAGSIRRLFTGTRRGCPRCHYTGERTRLGRRLYERIRHGRVRQVAR